MAQKINQSSSKASAAPDAKMQLSAVEAARAGASPALLRKLQKEAKEVAEKDTIVNDQDVVAAEEVRDVILAQASTAAAPAAAPAAAGLSTGTLAAIGIGAVAAAASGGSSGSAAAPPPPSAPPSNPQSFTLTDRAVTYKLVSDIDTSAVDRFERGIDPSWFQREGTAATLTTTTKSEGVVSSTVSAVASAGTDKIYADAFTLHGAFLDAGAGTDYLFIDMKGPFSQPSMAAGIEVVTVTNLRNVYNDNVKFFSDGIAGNLGVDVDRNGSILDLSRAVDIETLIVREGSSQDCGALEIWNVKSGTNVVLSGYFQQNTRIDFGNGQDALNLTLSNFKQESSANLEISHDASVVNLKSFGQVNEDGTLKTGSIGSGNYIDGLVFGSMLTTLNISGANKLTVDSPVTFRDDVVALVNASATTGGVEMTIARNDNVKFVGGAGNDILLVQGDNGFGGDFSIALDADMGAGTNVLGVFAEYNATTYVRSGFSSVAPKIVDTGAGTTTFAVVGGGDRSTSIVDLTAIDISDIDQFVFDDANASIRLSASQVTAAVLEKFVPSNDAASNGGLIITNLGSAAIDLSDLNTGFPVELHGSDTVTINAGSVLGNENSGAVQFTIDARGGNASITMTAAQFAQLQGAGNVEVLTNNNPATNANYTAALRLTGITKGQTIDFTDVNNMSGLTEVALVVDGTTTAFAPTAQFAITDGGLITTDEFIIINIASAASGNTFTISNATPAQITYTAGATAPSLTAQQTAAQGIAAQINSEPGRLYDAFANGSQVSLAARILDTDLPDVTVASVGGVANILAQSWWQEGGVVISAPGIQNNVILEISGQADLTNANLANVDGIRLVDGARVTLSEAQLETFTRITGAGDLIVELVGNDTITLPTSTGGLVDYSGINLTLKNDVGAAATATVQFAGDRDIRIKGIDTLAGVTALTIVNGMAAGTTLDIIGGTPALTLSADTTALTITSTSLANNTVIGSSALYADISGAGLRTIDLNGTASSTIDAGVINSASQVLTVTGNNTGTNMIKLPGTVPANSDWTFANIGVVAAAGTTFGTNASITADGTTAFSGGIAVDSIPLTQDSNVKITSALSAAQITSVLGKLASDTAYVDATGMSLAQKQAVAAAFGKISAALGAGDAEITGIVGTLTLDSALTATEITNLLSKYNTASAGFSIVDATSMTTAQLVAVAAGNATVDRINNLTVTSAQNAAQIGQLLGDAQGAVVNATSMATGQVSAIATAIAAAANPSGVTSISGLTLRSDQDATAMANLFSKVTGSGVVAIDATSYIAAQMNAAVNNIAKVSAITNLTIDTNTNAVPFVPSMAEGVASILSKATSAAIVATGATLAELQVFAANMTNVAAAGVTDLTVTKDLTAAEMTALLAKATSATASLTDMATAQTDVVVANIAKVGTLSGSTTAAVLTSIDDAVSTLVTATSVTSISGSVSQLTELFKRNAGGDATNDNQIETIELDTDFTVTVNDAAGTALTAAQIKVLNDETTEAVTISNAVAITGTLAAVTAELIESADPAGYEADDDGVIAASATITISDAAAAPMTAVELSNLGSTTSGTVTVTNAAVITGNEAQMTAALVTAASKVVAATSNMVVTDVDQINDAAEQLVISNIDAASSGTLTIKGDTNANTLNFTGYTASVLTIEGGAGNDSITGTGGADVIKGDAGDDTLHFATAAAADAATIDGGANADNIRIAAQVTSALDLNTSADSVQNVESLVLALGSTAAVTLDAAMTSASVTSGAGSITLTTAGQDVTGANNGALTVRAANALLVPSTTIITGGSGTGDNIIITDQVTSSLSLNSTTAMIAGVESLTLALGSTATVTLDDEMTDATVTSGAGDVTLSAVGQDVDGAANGASTVRATRANIAGSIIKGDNASGDTLVVTDRVTTATDFTTYADLQGVEVLNLALGSSAKVTLDAAMTSVVIAAGTATIETNAAGQTVNADALADAEAVTLTDTATTTATVTLVAGDLSASGYDGALTVTATTGSNIITTGAGNDTVTGGAGADTVTLGAGLDRYIVSAGHTVLTTALGSAETIGLLADGVVSSASGYDTVSGLTRSDGTIVSEALDVQGTATLVANGIINLTDKIAQQIIGAASTVTVKSIEVANGVGVFNDADAHTGNDLVIKASTLAAAIDALQASDLGDAGKTVAFAYDDNGDGDVGDAGDGLMVFTQGADDGTNSLDTLVFLIGQQAVDALITTNTAGSNDLFIA